MYPRTHITNLPAVYKLQGYMLYVSLGRMFRDTIAIDGFKFATPWDIAMYSPVVNQIMVRILTG